MLGSAGVEQQYNDELAGAARWSSATGRCPTLFVDRDTTANVTLSCSSKVQQAAIDALGDRGGSVVALDPRTGEILALYSNPAYDPNLLAAHVDQGSRQAQQATSTPTRQKPLLHAQLS